MVLGTGAPGPTGRGALFNKENKPPQLHHSPWLITATVRQLCNHHRHHCRYCLQYMQL